MQSEWVKMDEYYFQRVKDGDKTVSDIAARFAKQAIEAS